MDGWIKMQLSRKVGLDPSNNVLDGDLASPPQKGGQNPQFSAHVYCGQTPGWIKMPLGTEVGLCPGNIVLDEETATPPRGTAPYPNFRPMSVAAKRLDGSRSNLVRREASAQATLCYVGTEPHPLLTPKE